MGQANCLDKVLVGAHRPGHSPPDLRHLERMGQPRAIVIAFVVDEDLGLIFQATEGRGVQYPVPVPLERGSVTRFGLIERATARL